MSENEHTDLELHEPLQVWQRRARGCIKFYDNDDHDKDDPLIGTWICKRFVEGDFTGRVVGRWDRSRYAVFYTDGDSEHLTASQIKRLQQTTIESQPEKENYYSYSTASNRKSVREVPPRAKNPTGGTSKRPKSQLHKHPAHKKRKTTPPPGDSSSYASDDNWSEEEEEDEDSDDYTTTNNEDDIDMIEFLDETEDHRSRLPPKTRTDSLLFQKDNQVIVTSVSSNNIKINTCNNNNINKKKKETSLEGSKYVKVPYTEGQHLPLITEPQHMFDDMIQQLLTLSNTSHLQTLQTHLSSRTIRVATMCSGTESPILALDMIQNALQKQTSTQLLHIQHVFSCEIEPFKQAYIERNFQPPLLFRDIRDLKHDTARTAYGAMKQVPIHNIDMLVAGTSCVDFSNMNTNKKTLDDGGESAQTFQGMLDWVQRAQPTVIILENLDGANWSDFVERVEQAGYKADFLKLDTKHYYIPHTRNRGYLFAIHASKVKNHARTDAWKQLVQQLKRVASASIDDFMLPNDDPRVLRGRQRLTLESCSNKEGAGDRAGRTDWTRCETRHQDVRALERLGEKRPLTGWSESTKTTMPPFAWNDWTNAQVHRIHDLLDCNCLRMAQAGIDSTYKTMVWNLSQNVDRDTMGRLGLCQCLTPTGVPYVTGRGGPLVGQELLLFQGIPHDSLLLTKETEENLKDLAGNAMSTTVVGACMLSALITTADLFDKRSDDITEVTTLVPRPLVALSPVEINRSFGVYEEYNGLVREQDSFSFKKDWASFLYRAKWSSRLCLSEGQIDCFDVNDLRICRLCQQTVSADCCTPPRKYEEHSFGPLELNGERPNPVDFRKELLQLLPISTTISISDIESLDASSVLCNEAAFEEYATVLGQTIENDDGPVIFRFTYLNRAEKWCVQYKSDAGSRLEVHINERGVTWYLFSDPDTRGKTWNFKEMPLAKLNVEHSFEESSGSNFLIEGTWQLLLPIETMIPTTITYRGEKLKSWRNRLGLKGTFEQEYDYETIDVSLDCDDQSELKTIVEGSYDALQKCGTACGLLRKKRSTSPSSPNVFMFLESGRISRPEEDSMVFSYDKHRTEYKEFREILLKVDPNEYYRTFHVGDDEAESSKINLVEVGKWVKLPSMRLDKTPVDESIRVSYPSSSLQIHINDVENDWKAVPEIVSCTFPLGTNDSIVRDIQHFGKYAELNLRKANAVFEKISFVASRLEIPREVLTSWSQLVYSGDSNAMSEICAPLKPSTKWKIVAGKKGKKQVLPLEDIVEAGVYEQNLKSRPEPWVVRLEIPILSKNGDSAFVPVTLKIGFNAFSLTQRAMRQLPRESLCRKMAQALLPNKHTACMSEYRIIDHVDKSLPEFPKLFFTSNKRDPQASQPPNFKRYPLRKEQLRSLHWMLEQESSVEPFYEEEVTENLLSSLNWRGEGRVTRPVLVRGGIIADEVGYGKTAITLGLIDASRAKFGSTKAMPPPESCLDGRVFTPATLVLVPSHLMGQWPDEIRKFLGPKMNVISLKTLNDLNKKSAREIMNADIVIASFGLFNSDKYFPRLARFTGVDPSGLAARSSGRYFDSIYSSCLERIPSRIEQLRANPRDALGEIKADAAAAVGDGVVTTMGKKQAYAGKVKVSSPSKSKQVKIDPKEVDPWDLGKLKKESNFLHMKSPPLEMFFWNRLVVDEFHYLQKDDRYRALSVIRSIQANYRWNLSGTPPHGNFDDVKTLASLLGVHLGVEEILPGLKLTKSRLGTESTSLENMALYFETRSLQWHERRHRLAQKFLDRFLRQNIAEIDEIKYEESLQCLQLPPIEQAIYLELETHLKSLDMCSGNAQKSRKKSTSDRDQRMQRILKDSDTAEEALLKCCSQFNLSDDARSPEETLLDLIELRKCQLKELEKTLLHGLAAAFTQQDRIVKLQGGRPWDEEENEKGKVANSLKVYMAHVDNSTSVSQGADQEVHCRLKDLVKKAEKEFSSIDYGFEPASFYEANFGVKANAAFFELDHDEMQKAIEASMKKYSKSRTAEERLYFMKRSVRHHMHNVRALGKELCGRMRSLRYATNILRLTKQEAVVCPSCCDNQENTPSDHNTLSMDNVGLLSCCGHIGCLKCLADRAEHENCIDASCEAHVSSQHIVSSSDLNLNCKKESGQFGRKLEEILPIVEQIIGKGERLIIFYQFDQLRNKIQEALSSRSVDSRTIPKGINQALKVVSDFQKETLSPSDPRVLLLKMDDEQSAGLNLTNLNHAIFVHPLLANSKQEYDAYEAQAIGRIRRYGQKRTVFVHRFIAEKTIDMEIYESRRQTNEYSRRISDDDDSMDESL